MRLLIFKSVVWHMISILIIFLLPLLALFSIGPIKMFLFKRRWKKIKAEPLPDQYSRILISNFYPFQFLTSAEKEQLLYKIHYFLRHKYFHGLQNFTITDEMKILIAAQACLLILNIDREIYPSLVNIYISSSAFIEKDKIINIYSPTPFRVERVGESWKDGPVVLAWSSVKEGLQNWQDGHNVVLHEFAHQLDALNGDLNGTPGLSSRNHFHKWKMFMTKDFLELREKVKTHHQSDIDIYGAKNPAEFFAITVEYFFEKSKLFKQKHPEIFALYLDYFKIDPTRWSRNLLNF